MDRGAPGGRDAPPSPSVSVGALGGVEPRPGAEETGGEVEVLRLIAEGRVDQARGALDDRGRDDLFAALATCDVRLHLGEIDVPELQLLEHRARTEDPTGHSAHWLAAMICERLLLDFDPLSVLTANAARAELGDDLLPLLGLYSRARITRIAASSWLLHPTIEHRREARSLRDAAIRDLVRCGFTQEVTVTLGLAAASDALLWGEDLQADFDAMQGARRSLGAETTIWSVALDASIAVVALQLNNTAEALAAADRIDASPIGHRSTKSYPPVVRALAALVTSGAAPAEVIAFEHAVDDIGRDAPGTLGAFKQLGAHLLADLASPATARFARACLDLPRDNAERDADLVALELRLAIAAGKPPPPGTTSDLVDGVAATGRTRHAAALALRFANDLARRGDDEEAAALRDWGIARLPAPEHRTPWEQFLVVPPATTGRPADRPGTPAVAGDASRDLLSVSVLTPMLTVSVGKNADTLNDSAAKLVLALAIAHPKPVHVEQVSDLLWPDQDLAVTRTRLSSLIHRLGERLADAPHRLVVRDSNMLRLHDDVTTDLARFDRTMTDADVDQRLDALLAVTGILCDRQFPYDEAFLDPRRAFVTRWLRHAADVAEQRPPTRPALTAGARALDIDPVELEATSASPPPQLRAL